MLPALDVTFLLDLNLFRRSDLGLLRQVARMREDGTTDTVPVWVPLEATVKPASGRELVQTGEGDAVQGDIVLYSRTHLSAGEAETEADIVLYGGVPHRVIRAQLYGFGQRFTRAVGRVMPINPSTLAPL